MIQVDFQLQQGAFVLDVNLRLPARGVTALFGRSGSGKTTLLRCMAGLAHQLGGRMVFQGDVWQNAQQFVPVHQRPIGYVFQEASLFPHLRMIDNLKYGYLRLRKAEQRLQPDQVSELLGIQDLLQRYPDQLSGGQRQRVAIGRALLTSPRLLLMDEPMASLDATSKAEILPFLERLRDELDIPIVYVSHAIEEVTRLADHLVLLDHGRVQAQGALQTLLTDPSLPFAHQDRAASLLMAQVVEPATDDHLTQLQVDGQPLLISQLPGSASSSVRLSVMARDVVLANEPPQHISLINCLKAQVVDIQPDPKPSHCLVRLRLNQQTLLARISYRSVKNLKLSENQPIYALIKGVALN